MAEQLVPIITAWRLVIVADGMQPWKGRVFPDEAPAGTAFPYVTLRDFIGDPVATVGDAQVTARARNGQADLWEKAAAEDPSEDGALATLKALIDGAKLHGIPSGADVVSAENHVFRCRLRDTIRDPLGLRANPKIAHHTLDVILTYAV